jgi:hypothetical protein
MEDIYRAAGIMNPRKGYSINKAVEMLHSEHIRGLSKEMKWAAVLMALDAAGVLIDQVQHDARARQDAMDCYEAERRKQAEAEWERKAEEIVQIQAELERVKEQYMVRISRSLDAVAREKATFTGWQTMKQQEIQSISEACRAMLEIDRLRGRRPFVPGREHGRRQRGPRVAKATTFTSHLRLRSG